LSEERSALEFTKDFDTPVIATAGNDGANLDDEGEFFTGRVIELPQLGGLHPRYERRAA
jgi:hypothetical protein